MLKIKEYQFVDEITGHTLNKYTNIAFEFALVEIVLAYSKTPKTAC